MKTNQDYLQEEINRCCQNKRSDILARINDTCGEQRDELISMIECFIARGGHCQIENRAFAQALREVGDE